SRCHADDADERPSDATVVEQLLEQAVANPSRVLFRRMPVQSVVWGLLAALIVASVPLLRHHLWTPAAAMSTTTQFVRMATRGEPVDWTRKATTLLDLDGQVHCYSLFAGGKMARLVWGAPRRAVDVNLSTGASQASEVPAETYE